MRLDHCICELVWITSATAILGGADSTGVGPGTERMTGLLNTEKATRIKLFISISSVSLPLFTFLTAGKLLWVWRALMNPLNWSALSFDNFTRIVKSVCPRPVDSNQEVVECEQKFYSPCDFCCWCTHVFYYHSRVIGKHRSFAAHVLARESTMQNFAVHSGVPQCFCYLTMFVKEWYHISPQLGHAVIPSILCPFFFACSHQLVHVGLAS